jgi:uncharacterized protein YjeT (DUF2065 family)
MNSLETIAFIFVLAGLIKILFLLIFPKSWKNFVRNLYKKPNLLLGIELVLTVIIFYYLIQYLTIIQIIGGVVLGALLTGMTFAVYGKEIMPLFTKIFTKRDLFKKAWLPILLWLILIIWVLKFLFF